MFLQLKCRFPVSRGACVVAKGGHAWLPGGACVVVGGHAWLRGVYVVVGGVCGCQGACMVAGGWGACVVAGGHAWLPGGCGCRGHAWLGGMHGCQWGVPCDLSHHAFDVTCMLSPHQLRASSYAPAYILVGHVTRMTPSPPLWTDRHL